MAGTGHRGHADRQRDLERAAKIGCDVARRNAVHRGGCRVLLRLLSGRPSQSLRAPRKPGPVARPVPPELVESFAKREEFDILSSHALSIVELRPNYRSPPFDDPGVRRALSLAIDRQELVDRVMLGRAGPGDRGYPHPASPWTDPESSTPHDPSRAALLLDSLKFTDRDGDGVRESADGVPLRMELLVDAGESARVRAAEVVARQLTRYGFELSVVALESGALSERSRVRDYHLFVSEIGPHGAADPDQFLMSHLTGYLWQQDMSFPAWEAGFEKWKAATTVESRLQASFDLQRIQPFPHQHRPVLSRAGLGLPSGRLRRLDAAVRTGDRAQVVPGSATTGLRQLAVRLRRASPYVMIAWVAVTLNFLLPRMAPGDPLDYLIGPEADALSGAQRTEVLAEFGLDRPLAQQYGHYLVGIVRGDLGTSLRYGRPVTQVLLERLPWTLLLVFPALILSTVLATLLGVWAAARRGRAVDGGLVLTTLFLDSLPAFWIGMVLIAVFSVQLGWFPSFGAMPLIPPDGLVPRVAAVLYRMVLPLTALVVASWGTPSC